jgi:AraC family transcriptional regulator
MQQRRDMQRSDCRIAEGSSHPARQHFDLGLAIEETFASCATTNAVDFNAGYAHSDPPRCEDVDQRPHTSADTGCIERFLNDVISKNDNDPIIRSLSRELEAARQQYGQHCAEGLRLAIAVGLWSEVGASAKSCEIKSKRRQVRPLQKWRLKRVIEYVDDHLSAKITLSDLAAVAGLSRMHFASQFRKATGFRPHEFVLRRRIGRAEEMLMDTTMSIVHIALTVGFQTQAQLTTVFKRFVGCTPGRCRASKQVPSAPPSQEDRRAEITDAVVSATRSFEKELP